MEQLIKDAGFAYFNRCTCGGTLNVKYKKGDYSITLFPKRGKFTAYKNGNTVKSGREVDLADYLNQIAA